MPFDGVETPLSYLATFDQVIDLIEAPNQWIKHTYRSPWGGYCLKEALNTMGVAEVFEPIILKTAAELTSKEFCCIESFNDAPQTVHADVVAVLHRVRDDVAAGKVHLPPPGMAKPTVRWSEHQTAKHRVSGLWRKLLCWT